MLIRRKLCQIRHDPFLAYTHIWSTKDFSSMSAVLIIILYYITLLVENTEIYVYLVYTVRHANYQNSKHLRNEEGKPCIVCKTQIWGRGVIFSLSVEDPPKKSLACDYYNRREYQKGKVNGKCIKIWFGSFYIAAFKDMNMNTTTYKIINKRV